ncbi:MFS transporter [Microbacterium tenebrionis]|uniref:MFS transporter n=1 Tax=Microbacterium tenebrionis TaxID=2830665 RepID=A0A9X1S0D8_9MICO|nr:MULTISPECIES: MFS transporter [Microbacterium]MCC2029142.1 MFS transporter [Microbacterium tenebrionis]
MNTAVSGDATATGSIWRQPAQVWAVAFASVVAFMGIGLVDPILPAIAESLQASPTETELLFTSYLLVTGVAMLITSWVSSRIGAKATLMIGLGLIVAFALASALSGSVDAIIGFRAGWGLGNALFISTALATIVGSASGGSGAAIVLYEAALGLGIAIGPLLGGLLGEVSWRGPFFGVVALMAIAFIAVFTLLRGSGEKRVPVRFSAPFTALGRPALAILAVAALFYNIGFFVLLAFSPFPLGFGAMGIGFTFFGWGAALAITSIWLAPWMMRRMSRTAIILTMLPLLAVDLVAAGILAETASALVVCIIIGGLLLGVMNTVLTEAVMEATDLPRSVASSAYSAVRFIGGAMAPPIAALLWHAFNSTVPYLFAAASVLVAALTVLLGRRILARIDDEPKDRVAEDAEAITVGDAA